MNPGTQADLTPARIDEMLAAMQNVFRQVGPLIVERAGTVSHTDKADGSPVTETDVEVEHIIQTEMMRRFPDVPVYGEEGTYENNMAGNFWLLDPIDGTRDFIQNTPKFTVMGVLVGGGVSEASVIYNPSSDDMYVACRGKGAFKNGTRLDIKNLPLATTAVCKSMFVEQLNGMLQIQGVTCEANEAAIGYEYTMLLDGHLAARFNMHARGYTHDYAPGALLVREAGGAIVPILDETYTYQTKSFVACHPELAAALQSNVPKLRELENS